MSRRFDLIVFDWDGTLMDSAACIAASLQSACEDLGYPVPSDRDARYIIGLSMRDALAHVLPQVPPSDYQRIAERYRHHFLKGDADTTLFMGMFDLLRELHDQGYLLAVATGKSRRGLDRALAATGLEARFHATRCADEGHTKPDPRMLQWLLDTLGVTPERALMIGDTSHDMLMAQAAGVPRLGIAHGAHDLADLLKYEPLACVHDCAELRSWLADHA